MRSQNFNGRLSRYVLVTLVSLIPGCEKVPTFQELTGKEANSTPVEQKSLTPGSSASAPAVPTPELSPKPEPVTRAPAEVLAEIMKRPSHDKTDADLGTLASLPTGLEVIDSLDLTKSPVTDEGVKHLSKLQQLTQLSLANTMIRGSSFTSLKELPNLHQLTLDVVKTLDANAWENLAGLSQLETLNLVASNVTDADVAKLAGMVNLRELNLSQTPVSDAVFAHVEEMKGLEVLRIELNSNIKGHGLQVFTKSKGSKLRELHASGTPLNVAGLKHVKSIPSLKLFDLSDSNLTDQQLFEMRGAGNIVTLILGNNRLTAASMTTLASMRNLEELDLQNNSTIDDTALGALSKMKGLKSLNVARTACSPRGLQEFARLHKNCKLISNSTPGQ